MDSRLQFVPARVGSGMMGSKKQNKKRCLDTGLRRYDEFDDDF